MNRTGCLTRRQFVAASLIAGAVSRLVPDPVLATAEHWRPEDGLRLAGPQQGVISLDPALSRDLQTNFLVRQSFRGLVEYDENHLPIPDLARSIDVSDDLRTYTFVLRDDATFHDGRSIDAQDVRFSLSRAISPATSGGDPTGLAATIYLGDIVGAEDLLLGTEAMLAGVEVIDDRTLRIGLSVPSTTFLMKLAAVPASIVDRHQDFSDGEWWRRLNGSGPYTIGPETGDELLHLRAVESWKSAPVPVRDIRIRVGPTAGNAVNLFQNGEIDLIRDVPPSQVSLLEDPATRLDEATLLEQPQFALSYIAFGNQNPPLDDVHVRRALQRIFPVSQFANATFDGRVIPAHGIIPPGMLGRDWAVDRPDVDVVGAREDLSRSRYRDGGLVPVVRIYAADIAQVETLRDVAMAELGLRIEAVQVGWFDFLNGLTSRRWDAYSLYWGADYPDPEALLWVLFGSDSPENYTGYANPEVDALLDLARQEGDEQARHDIYVDVQQRLIDDAAMIPVYVPVRYAVGRAGISHIPLTPMGILGLETLT